MADEKITKLSKAAEMFENFSDTIKTASNVIQHAEKIIEGQKIIIAEGKRLLENFTCPTNTDKKADK